MRRLRSEAVTAGVPPLAIALALLMIISPDSAAIKGLVLLGFVALLSAILISSTALLVGIRSRHSEPLVRRADPLVEPSRHSVLA